MRLGYLCRRLAVVLLFSLASCAVSATELTGTYRAEGTGANGSAYAGQAALERHGKGVTFAWGLDTGGRYRGLGLQLDDALGAVFWPEGEKLDGLGVVVYEIDGGTMQGIWLPMGGVNTPLGRENLVGPASLEGRFEIALGENPGGRTHYRGHVMIERRGDVHFFHWYTPAESYVGNGVRIGNIMVVGYALGRAPGTIAYCIRGGDLDGVWAYGDDTRLGREKLVRQPRPAETTGNGARSPGCVPVIAMERFTGRRLTGQSGPGSAAEGLARALAEVPR